MAKNYCVSLKPAKLAPVKHLNCKLLRAQTTPASFSKGEDGLLRNFIHAIFLRP